ncbi:T9SS-dependent choice-of-anchor J family protein [Chryseobacterium sp. PMSZPI]|uniref:T9SS-dependent choice-of-anchor J family protein n=1 Tax=Chryseobacterium sp. PMSZPI TaxID=1033900 RepID=UPI000C32EC1C|nr:choice-of-anchor J domain-containing protein [Chryseobacterium sp. PMSZPI]PKF75876.1 hypothetical protein CW752_02185 [Chryseobacterium sp. PMSZPI]
MKKVLLSIVFILLNAISQINAQTLIFEEKFETTPTFQIPSGWIAIARNGGSGWMVSSSVPSSLVGGFSGKVVSVRASSMSDDKLLITPLINLQAGNSFSLNFLIGATGSANKHYAVYVLQSPVSSFTGTETPALEGNISTGGTAVLKTINLSGYGGQNVRVYFRMFNSSGDNGTLILDDVQIRHQGVLGTSEIKQDSHSEIYPNPVSDDIHLKSEFKIIKAEVFDATARKMNTTLNNSILDVRNLQPGTYLINITTTNKTYSQKFIKK